MIQCKKLFHIILGTGRCYCFSILLFTFPFFPTLSFSLVFIICSYLVFRKLFFGRGIRQKYMHRIVQTIFPKEKIERNTKKVLTAETGNPMEIDCFLPNLGLGFEYQVCAYAYVLKLSLIINRSNIIILKIPTRYLKHLLKFKPEIQKN